MRPGTSAQQGNGSGQRRTYYIAADEVNWDYVPGGANGITGEPFKSVGFFPNPANPLGKPLEKEVGTSYLKALVCRQESACKHQS
jgi:manganese oxidase